MHLVVFDIDGTLTDTCDVDHGCYWQAVCESFGIEPDQPDWATFRNVTDSGIARESCERYLGRVSTSTELNAVRTRLVRLLRVALPPKVNQIQGAHAALLTLRQSPDFVVALATGGFRVSAEIKLQRAGLYDSSIPLASSDDDVSRVQIMRLAARRAAQKYAVHFAAFTHVGDGVWDVRAAQSLGWTFIGVGARENAERLRGAGAHTIIPDYLPIEKFLTILRGSRQRAA